MLLAAVNFDYSVSHSCSSIPFVSIGALLFFVSDGMIAASIATTTPWVQRLLSPSILVWYSSFSPTILV